jgi:hypothetical protein
MSEGPAPDPPAPPDLPEPLPPDPRSIGVWPGFVAGCRAWARLAVPLTALFAVVMLPLVVLLVLSAPTLAPVFIGQPPPDEIPPREFLGFFGVMLLGWLGGGLATIAGFLMADRVLAGSVPPGARETADFVLERVLPVVGAYFLFILVLIVPGTVVGGVMGGLLGATEGSAAAGPVAVVFLLLFLGVLLPAMVAGATYLRFMPLLAALRDRGPVAALRSSFALVRDRWWRTLGYAMLVAVTAQAVLTAAMVVGMFAHALHPLLGLGIYGLASAFVMPFHVVQEVSLLRRLEATSAPAAVPAPPGLTDPA